VTEWRYCFSAAGDDLHVRLSGFDWAGLFSCAPRRHVEALWWPAAHAVVVAAGSALYLVDPDAPTQFGGFEGLFGITDLIFDESGDRLFVADSVRVHAFSADRRLRWVSEELGGFDARFVGAGGRVVALRVTSVDDDEVHETVRLRAEDGTVLQSRLRVALRHWRRNQAA
jgi:hypothetical protein